MKVKTIASRFDKQRKSTESHPIYITNDFAKRVTGESVRREYGDLAADKCSETFDSIIDKPKKLLASNFE